MDLSSMIAAPPDSNIAVAKALAALSAPNLLAPGSGPAMTSGMPNPGAPALPSVMAAPTHTQLDQNELQRRIASGSMVSQILHPADPTTGAPTGEHVGLGRTLAGGIARAGDIALSLFAPNLERLIPGTEGHHQMLVAQQAGNVQRDQAQAQSDAVLQDSRAQAELRSKEADKYGAQTDDLTPITLTPDQAAVINHPELSGTTTTMRDYSRLVGLAGKDNTSASNNAATNATRQSISDDKNAAAATKPQQRDDRYISVMEKAPGDRTPEDLAFQHAYEALINTKTTQPGIARAVAMGNSRPVQVVLPSGQAGYTTAGNAIKTGATSLGDNSYKAEGAALKDFTSGTDSHTLTAFNTAKGHLQQLAAAGDALQNDDLKALNAIANTYGTHTGQSAPTVFQGVKTAVSGEIAKAFTGAGATVDEIGEIRKSINDANSPEQLHDVIASYSHLLDTKSAALRSQFSAAKKAQPNFGGTNGTGDGDVVEYVRVNGKLVPKGSK